MTNQLSWPISDAQLIENEALHLRYGTLAAQANPTRKGGPKRTLETPYAFKVLTSGKFGSHLLLVRAQK